MKIKAVVKKIAWAASLAALAVVLWAGYSQASTFYISPTGSDSSGNGTSSSPWRTATKAFTMGGGHTYVWKDGTYNYANGNIANPPSGNPVQYTVLKAENDGGAVLSGYTDPISVDGRSYVQFEGFTIKNGASSHAVYTTNSNHLKFFRIGIKNGASWNERYANIVEFSDGSEYILAEDMWVVGVMRYGILTYATSGTNTRYIVLRRCVVRFDGSNSVEPKAGISNYGATSGIEGSTDILMENCIALDFNPPDNSAGEGLYTGFYNPHSGKRIKNYGSIALNIPASGFMLNEDSDSQNNEARNCLAYDVKQTGFFLRDASGPTILNQVTAGKCQTDGGYRNYGTSSNVSITNSVFLNNGQPNHAANTDSYNLYYPSSLKPSGAGNALTSNPGITYLPQIPTESSAYHSGQGGVTRGAVIMQRYGVSGTLWGETGYDQLTSDSLWPWPYEKRIHDLFAEPDSISGNATSRGFAASGQTLTKYIWEYLGHPIPDSIYAGQPIESDPVTPPPPAQPDKLRPSEKFITPLSTGAHVTFGDDATDVTIVNVGGSAIFHRSKSGNSNITWDGRSENGQVVESGAYLCKIRSTSGEIVFHLLTVVK